MSEILSRCVVFGVPCSSATRLDADVVLVGAMMLTFARVLKPDQALQALRARA
jgi:hypothetical protein